MTRVPLAKAKYMFLMDDQNEMASDKEPKEYLPPTNNNQIYFYDDVSRQSIFTLNRTLDHVEKSLLYLSINYNLSSPPPIQLFINSEGGEVFSALSAVDRIKSSKVPVYSYVEGIVASAATLISVVSHKRYMRQNSFMLVHQISSGYWGTYQQFQDESKNLDLLMKYIKNIYLKHTKFTEKELDNLLTHDIYLSPQECLEKGLVDEIIG